MPAITFDVVVLAAFTNLKLRDNPLCVAVAMADTLTVFVFERLSLGKWFAASKAAEH